MMKMLVLADIDDLDWRGERGRADVLLSLGDIADAVILQAAEAWQCPIVLAVKGDHDSDAPFPSPSSTCTCGRWNSAACAAAA